MAQSVIGTVGFVANMIVIPILCSDKLRSIFNRLLASLVLFDNCFLFLTLVEILRQRLHGSGTEWLNAVFAVFIFPMRNIFLCCTIYVAIALAYACKSRSVACACVGA